MPRLLRLLPFLLLTLAIPACGPSEAPYTDNSKDPDLYAQDVKQIAMDAIQRAKKSREPADQIQTLVSELESQQSNSRPVGSHKAIYDELLGLAKEFVSACNASGGKPANMTARLDAMTKVAERLPGKVQLGK
jgi:hypothetical protein